MAGQQSMGCSIQHEGGNKWYGNAPSPPVPMDKEEECVLGSFQLHVRH